MISRNAVSPMQTWEAALESLRSAFGRPGWAIFSTFLTGWVLCTGRRTVVGIYRQADPDGQHAHDAFHRFIRCGAWKPEVLWRLLAQADRLRGAEAEAAQASSLSLGGQFQRDSDGTWAVFATAGLRWSAFDRGQRAKAVAAEAVEKNLGQALQAEHQAAVELDVAEHEVEYTRETLAMLEKSLIPALQSLVAARQEAYRRGTGSLVDLLRARRGLLEAQRRHAGASGDRAWAEVKAWMLLATLRQEARP